MTSMATIGQWQRFKTTRLSTARQYISEIVIWQITKKNVVEYMDANASDDFKAANGLPVSKSALKKTTKDEFVKIYAVRAACSY